MALEALEADELDMVDDGSGNMVFRKEQAITAMEKLLAQPEQEPVAWGVFEGNLHDMFFTEAEAVEMAQLKGDHAEVKPLYTAPQRTWVGLTKEEKHQIRYSHMTSAEFIEFIEAKLKEKNI
jgi:hypothetical protein